MKFPLPTNKLVALTIVGAFVAVLASVALAFPAKHDPVAALPSDAPPEDPNFQPAVQEVQTRGGEHEENEEEEHGEREDHDEREHDGA
ncbi:MAG: hypothetical protein WDA16_11865 [Candidatus Thermoplasmatota archaeon]